MRSKNIGTRCNKFGTRFWNYLESVQNQLECVLKTYYLELFGKCSKSIRMRSKNTGTRSNKFGTRFWE